ncbi:MAG: cell division protein FtsQ/DivIB [bacterium]
MKVRKILILIIGVCLSGFIIGIIIGRSSLFRVRKLTIICNSPVDNQLIEQISGINIGANIFDVDLSTAEERIERYWLIKKAKITNHNFGNIAIYLYLRYPVIEITDKLGMDPDGFIIPLDQAENVQDEIALLTPTIVLPDRNLLSANRIIPPGGVLSPPAYLLARGYDLSIIDKLLLSDSGLTVVTKDEIVFYIGDNSFYNAFRIILSMRNTSWWNARYSFDLSNPGELLVYKKIGRGY